jgi:hypothetical protein
VYGGKLFVVCFSMSRKEEDGERTLEVNYKVPFEHRLLI